MNADRGKLLECRGLCQAYGRVEVLRDVNLTLEPGRIVGLLGPNGAGKSTLIKLICGLLQPKAGEILIDGYPPSPYTKSVISYLPERTYLDSWMTAEKALRMFADFYADFRYETARKMLEQLQVSPHVPLKHLSKGTREKIQLVLVMSRNAKLYVLDEPIGGVDPAARDYILSTILSNYQQGSSILLSTHLIADVESILDEVVFLKDGSIFLHDTVERLRREQDGKSVDQLFREVFRC